MALLSTSRMVIGAVSVGVAGSAGIGGYFYATRDTNKTIQELFKSEKNKTLLVSDDVGKQSTAWNNYKKDNTDKTKNKDAWELTDWDEKHSESNLPQSLFDECEIKKVEKVTGTNDDKYKKFLKWCTK